jgi:hypothetical protein
MLEIGLFGANPRQTRIRIFFVQDLTQKDLKTITKNRIIENGY